MSKLSTYLHDFFDQDHEDSEFEPDAAERFVAHVASVDNNGLIITLEPKELESESPALQLLVYISDGVPVVKVGNTVNGDALVVVTACRQGLLVDSEFSAFTPFVATNEPMPYHPQVLLQQAADQEVHQAEVHATLDGLTEALGALGSPAEDEVGEFVHAAKTEESYDLLRAGVVAQVEYLVKADGVDRTVENLTKALTRLQGGQDAVDG